ncbi:hypothetical protein QOZ80_4AG0321480 [Eleusine coracana subsp. coracana]|nr:hypothetical protein QOZ80_4AG0321480 [Eleusine coracana subsp. coracana]
MEEAKEATVGKNGVIIPYVGHGGNEEEEVLEFNLDAEAANEAMKHMVMAYFFSGKKFNVKGMFEEMMVAWGISVMEPVQPLEENRFMLKFDSEETWRYVIEGGPWRHKGDALLVVPYDGFTRPSSIKFDAIQVWVRFYGLPPTMKSEESAKCLAGSLGEVIKVDARYPSYLQVRVKYPLEKALVPELRFRIRGRGEMTVTLRYENIPHFCLATGA